MAEIIPWPPRRAKAAGRRETGEIRDNEDVDAEARARLLEFVEKTALLRRDMQHKGELEPYEARFSRIEQKLIALADAFTTSDPDLAKALKSAWARPAMSLAFRNAEHQKKS